MRIKGDANTWCRTQRMAIDQIGLRYAAQNFVGDHGRIIHSLPFSQAQHHNKLVAAQASNQIALANGGLQPFGDFNQQTIADGMTERVIDHLEAVEVNNPRPLMCCTDFGFQPDRLLLASRWRAFSLGVVTALGDVHDSA